MGRIGFAMARAGLLPERLGRVHPRFGTPSAITALTVGFIAVLATFVPIEALTEIVSIGTLFAFTILRRPAGPAEPAGEEREAAPAAC